jgi:AraC family transcriptional regulator of adaptative response/methylated-DNA-[protein]-cysteine methyltransferase
MLKSYQFDTILGPMLAVSDEKSLYLLEFTDCRKLEKKLERLKQRAKSTISSGETKPIASIKLELEQYYSGKLKEFQTPIHLLGSPFQKQAWQALIDITYGETRGYEQQAQFIGKPTAYRAVANANAANKLAIIVPCHRIINSNGNLGGYGGGIWRKKWLLEHEKALGVCS